jgi:hypothetical protein
MSDAGQRLATAQSSRIAIVAGAIAQRPKVAGHAWVFINWVLGLRSLGYHVVFVDRLEPDMLERGDAAESSTQWHWLQAVMGNGRVADDVALLVDGGRRSLGMDRSLLLEWCHRADVLFNIMGYLDDAELMDAFDAPRVFVDIDPGFPQMWDALGLCDVFTGHDAFVTVGLAVGGKSSCVPTCGRSWITTPPPVHLRAWPEAPSTSRGARPLISEVATWRGPEGTLTYGGTTFGLRVHEFRRFAMLPRRAPTLAFHLALDIDPDDAADLSLLEAGGWTLQDPRANAGTVVDYRRYIVVSDAEFSVAKQMYVRSRCGWFSDRSACYLATGRPVVAQETGYSSYVPTGVGLVPFADPDEALDALREVTGDPVRHRKAARHVAEECFDARVVLRRLTKTIGVG